MYICMYVYMYVCIYVYMCVRHVLGPRGQGTSYQWLSHSRLLVRWCGSEHTGTLTTEAWPAMSS